MDRKNKKAAQQAAQAMQQQQGQEGGTTSTAATGTPREKDRSQQQNRRDRDKDKDKERSGRRDRASGGTSTGSRPPRDRAGGSEKRRDSTSTAQGDEPPANGMTSSVATLRPPIRIGKGPSTSASVTAPPVLRDTSATATMATSNESEASTGEKPSYASVTLEHLQAQSHSRQATITPATEPLALSDYSKTPNATIYDLPPSSASMSSPKQELLDSPTSLVHPLSSRTSAREGATSRERMRNDSSMSPPLSKDDVPTGRFGPVGSPPRAGFANGSPSDSAGTGRGALSTSFAGSRAVGWGVGNEARRPSLPGHNQRPSLGAASLRSGILDESAFEEENEDLEAEEFLPSSLSDLLTKEERERRFSRGGAIRPTKESLLPIEGLNTPVEDDEVWERTVRQRANAADQLSPDTANAFSRSVPATNLIGQVRSLWDRDATATNANSGLTTISRTNAPGGITQDMFGGVSGSYGPSPSMLSSSVMSNASNAFLQSSRLGAGEMHSSHKPLVNDLQVGSYNPSGMLYQKQQQMSHAAHQHHSSISGLSSLSARNGTQGVGSQAASGYSMYAGPPDLENKSGIGAMYGQRTSQLQQRPAMTTQNSSTHAHANDSLTGLRHEPGQSLPRGLGAGLSRLHFVPAGSLGSTVGSPPLGSGFGSTNPVASPPYGNFHMNMVGSGRGEPNDLAMEGKFTGGAQKSNLGSGLTARLMAGVGSQAPSGQVSYQSDPMQGDGRTGAMSIHNVRNQHSTWGSGSVMGQDDVDVDEGTLFNMD
ncbi:hypothetical protein FRC01_008898 [Tulasnella sp. 417]|nr:hypothetical protein FRC01_008898 [Tulasnella sp. 417]